MGNGQHQEAGISGQVEGISTGSIRHHCAVGSAMPQGTGHPYQVPLPAGSRRHQALGDHWAAAIRHPQTTGHPPPPGIPARHQRLLGRDVHQCPMVTFGSYCLSLLSHSWGPQFLKFYSCDDRLIMLV